MLRIVSCVKVNSAFVASGTRSCPFFKRADNSDGCCRLVDSASELVNKLCDLISCLVFVEASPRWLAGAYLVLDVTPDVVWGSDTVCLHVCDDLDLKGFGCWC